MRRFKLATKVLVAAALLLGSSAAPAGILYCAGTITAVYMAADGSVVVNGSWRSDYTQICSDQGTFGGIDSATCLSWFALAIKAQTGAINVTIYYPNAGSYTCANLPTYTNALTPGYLLISQ